MKDDTCVMDSVRDILRTVELSSVLTMNILNIIVGTQPGQIGRIERSELSNLDALLDRVKCVADVVHSDLGIIEELLGREKVCDAE